LQEVFPEENVSPEVWVGGVFRKLEDGKAKYANTENPAQDACCSHVNSNTDAKHWANFRIKARKNREVVSKRKGILSPFPCPPLGRERGINSAAA
jgi:hypothetical protein